MTEQDRRQPPSPMRSADIESLDGVRIHFVETGPEDGPVVLFVHGFPELSFSWRHQLAAAGSAGYRAVALDVRGYGRSGKPPGIEDYRMVKHVADNVALADHLGASRVVLVGHDWGSPITWSSALLRPDLFDAVCLMSVPYMTPGLGRPTQLLAQLYGPDNEFYLNYFQEPGRVEAEAEEDLRRWLGGFYYGASAEGAESGGAFMAVIPKGERMVDRLPRLDHDLDWLPPADLEVYVAAFEQSGITGGLNRYRNLDRDAEDFAFMHGCPLRAPTLYIGGDRDGPTIWGANAIGRFSETVPDLRGSHILEGCGHWMQQERPDVVNELLLGFLAEVRPI